MSEISLLVRELYLDKQALPLLDSQRAHSTPSGTPDKFSWSEFLSYVLFISSMRVDQGHAALRKPVDFAKGLFLSISFTVHASSFHPARSFSAGDSRPQAPDRRGLTRSAHCFSPHDGRNFTAPFKMTRRAAAIERG